MSDRKMSDAPHPASMARGAFFVSDRTGITAETLGHSLLSQFDTIRFEQVTMPFVDTVEKARRAVEQINEKGRCTGLEPLVFSTLIDPSVRHVVASSQGIFFDFFDTFIDTLEKELGVKSSHTVGRSHGVVDSARYNVRMDAVNFALGTDDGVCTQGYGRADVIIVGVSRSGKTPACLYLAMQYGIHCANYPLTEEELRDLRLPAVLNAHQERLFGLTIAPDRLHEIRSKRRPGSRYASLRQCRREIRQAEALYRQLGIRFLNTTVMSVEEMAASILHAMGLPRRMLP